MSTLLRATGLHKTFASKPPVLTDVELSARAGELTVISGAHGSGRTTLIRCLSGGYVPQSGHIHLTLGRAEQGTEPGAARPGEEFDLRRMDPRMLAWVRRHHLGVFDAALPVPPSQPAVDAVSRCAGVDADTARQGFHRLGLEAFADAAVGRLHAPERRSIALIAALLSNATVLLLDEPDQVADPQRVVDWINELITSHRAVVATSSAFGPLHSIAHHTATLNEGKLTWTAPSSPTSR